MAISLLTNQDQWDRLVDDSPHGLLYHKWDFLQLVEKYTGYKLLPYGVYKGEQMICVFPLFYKKAFGIKLVFSPPPQSGIPYLGPVMNKDYFSIKQDKKESYINQVAQEIDAELKKIAPNYFSVVMVPGFIDIRPFQWLNYQANPSYTYTFDLRPETEEIFKNFTSLCRQNIRKGENTQCQTIRCDDTSFLTDLLTERYHEQGLRHAVNKAYLKEALETYPEHLFLCCLSVNGKIIGATLNQVYKWYLVWMGLAKPRDENYKYANEFMIWQLMQQAKSLGLNKFEISGANKQSLCKYRSKFNPQLEPYFTITRKDTFGILAEAFYYNFIKKSKIF
jgi:hypothetical protein